METPSATALDEALNSVDVRILRTRRLTLGDRGRFAIPDGAPTLAYVVAGEITGDAVPGPGCALTMPDGRATGTTGPRTLLAGDAFLSLGRSQIELESVSGAQIMAVELEIERTRATDEMPGFVFVTGFAAHEPAAAALAANMGTDDGTPAQSGDPLICRMMATTVLLSLIRAWARLGCAPEGWLTQQRDPFLQRVIEAIHAEPGREWTVGLLAATGAMSRSAFAQRFRTAFGTSPASYVAAVRMRAAKDMLAAGLPVSRVSRDLGYASDEGFSRAFRRHTGANPSLWRSEASAGSAQIVAA